MVKEIFKPYITRIIANYIDYRLILSAMKKLKGQGH